MGSYPSNVSVEECDFSFYTKLDFKTLQELTKLLQGSELQPVDLIDKLDLDEFFQAEDIQQEIKTKCKNKSQKFPSLKINPPIWMFVQQVMREVNNLDQKKMWHLQSEQKTTTGP